MVNTISETNLAERFGLDRQKTAKAFAISDDSAAEANVAELLGRLDRELKSRCVLSRAMWRCEALSDEGRGKAALADAVDADLIVLSSHGSWALPERLRTWLDGLAAAGNLKCKALAALFDCTKKGSCESEAGPDWLKKFAARTKLDYFEQRTGVDLEELDYSPATLETRCSKRSSTLQRILDLPSGE